MTSHWEFPSRRLWWQARARCPTFVGMRNFARLCLAGVAVACSALVLSGCVQPGPVVTPHITPSATPLFASDADALAAATKAYAAYLKMSDLITSEGGARPERIADLVSAGQLNHELEGFTLFHDKKYVTRGESSYDTVSLQSNERLQDGQQEVVIYVCSDASDVRLLNQEGSDITPSDRPDRQPFELTFQTKIVGQLPLVLTRSELWSGTDFC